MALPSSLRSIKITNNTIHVGYSSNASMVTNHTYESCMSIGADSVINGNTVAGCIGGSSGSTNLASITSASCLIQNNVFVRGAGSPVGSYITFSGTHESVITGNIFDQTTIDGSSYDLVQGLPANSVYTANKNQVDFMAVPLDDFTHTSYINDFAGRLESESGYAINSGLNDGCNINFILEDSVQFDFGTTIPVGNLLPFGAKILEIKIGILCDDGGSGPVVNTGGDNQLDLYLRSFDRKSNYATGTGSILDPDSNTLTTSTNTLNFNNNTAFNTLMNGVAQYLTLDVSSSSDFNTASKMINAYVRFKLRSSAAFISVDLSPIVIKFTY